MTITANELIERSASIFRDWNMGRENIHGKQLLRDCIETLKDDGSTRLYFEAHITIAPMPDRPAMFDALADWAEQRDLRASKFEVDFVDEAHGAWFLSAKAESKPFLLGSIIGAVQELGKLGYDVTRWKIEETVWDSKHGDTFEFALQEIRA